MVRIAISHAAYDAIAAKLLLGSVAVEPQRAPNGDVYVWLNHAVVGKLKALRGPGETYSDVILALAATRANPSARTRANPTQRPIWNAIKETSCRAFAS